MCRVRRLRGDLDISTLRCIRQVADQSQHVTSFAGCVALHNSSSGSPQQADENLYYQQDEIGVPPRTILANMKKQASIPPPRRGWLTPLQIQNALKKVRRDNGTKNLSNQLRNGAREFLLLWDRRKQNLSLRLQARQRRFCARWDWRRS
ncbi:hypothetical protein GQ600_1335 [Phytophthora cactorum]|nr:hypothetical protein GQ600_1335 [Phytophthora cactorum]